FQRLRRIKQLGLTDMVYPGALHTRFHHAIGAMHLMSITLDQLRNKGIEISDEEYEAALLAILLHDIGHGPFSHALESILLKGQHHETLSLLFFDELNKQFNGQLSTARAIFVGSYERKFFHQLVSSQLDIDRLDYLQRDCFFTGVSEGTIGADRIIKMMTIINDEVVIEEKGIYSIENFLNARRLMYWQVYLHKTTVCAEKMLINLILRAKYLARSGETLPGSIEFLGFLKKDLPQENGPGTPIWLNDFAQLDDLDIWGAIKLWKNTDDFVLKEISKMFLTRNLFKIHFSNDAFKRQEMDKLKSKIQKKLAISDNELKYFFSEGEISNYGYLTENKILILTKKGKVQDVATAADLPNIKAMSKIVKKHYACHAKNLTLR
uniref:HD domain-containing protein n=1 Tax=uncultured Cyclobacterium sp. TaxID=453820 RepID=UPI0030EDE4F4